MLKSDILKILSKSVSGGSETRPVYPDSKKPECLHNRKHKCNRRSTNGLRDYELSRLSNTTATKSVVRGVVVVMRSD